jgi:hypothetical protein
LKLHTPHGCPKATISTLAVQNIPNILSCRMSEYHHDNSIVNNNLHDNNKNNCKSVRLFDDKKLLKLI